MKTFSAVSSPMIISEFQVQHVLLIHIALNRLLSKKRVYVMCVFKDLDAIGLRTFCKPAYSLEEVFLA